MLRIVRPAVLLACAAAAPLSLAAQQQGSASSSARKPALTMRGLREMGDPGLGRAVARRQVGRVRLSARERQRRVAYRDLASSAEHTVSSATVRSSRATADGCSTPSCRTPRAVEGAAPGRRWSRWQWCRCGAGREPQQGRSARSSIRRHDDVRRRSVLALSGDGARVALRRYGTAGRRGATSSCGSSRSASELTFGNVAESGWSDDGAAAGHGHRRRREDGQRRPTAKRAERGDSFARREHAAVHRARLARKEPRPGRDAQPHRQRVRRHELRRRGVA